MLSKYMYKWPNFLSTLYQEDVRKLRKFEVVLRQT